MRIIIGVAGPARAGKDTIAEALTSSPLTVAGMVRQDCIRFAFADIMKKHLARILEVDLPYFHLEHLKDEEIPGRTYTPRKAMQLFGTDFGRALHPDFWLHMADRGLGDGVWVIPDVRFENEATFCRQNGFMLHVWRPGCPKVEHHESENGVQVRQDDSVLVNVDTIEHLQEAAIALVERRLKVYL